jgi:hypothetical protein
VLNSTASRDLVLASTPLKIGSTMSIMVPYSTSLDLVALHYHNYTAVWVDLVELHPIMEVEANTMLAEIGPVIHSTVCTTCSRFQNV